MTGEPQPSHFDGVEAMFAQAFALHGKTIKGSLGPMGGVYALDFTDGTSLWIHAKVQDRGPLLVEVELKDEPL